jgi:hypothetical protein
MPAMPTKITMPGRVRIVFNKLCDPCWQRLEARDVSKFEVLERAVLDLADPEEIRVVDVTPGVFTAWRDGQV